MPANLTPDYERAERTYREAQSDDDRLGALREMFATIPKHKGTEKLQADIKHRISLLRKMAARAPARGPDLFHVPHAGAGQIVVAGLPNVGKSKLVWKITNGHAPVKITDYPFATALPVPGMALWHDIQLEFVDTPPVTSEHIPPGLIGTFHNSDILALVVDSSEDPLEETEALLSILHGREFILRSVPRDQLDAGNPHEHAALLLATKCDLAAPDVIDTLRELYADQLEVLPVSAETGEGLDNFLERCWHMLAAIRVYTKEPGLPADTKKPFVLDKDATVEALATEIHRALAAKLRFARLWRQGHPAGIQVHRTEVLHDGDIVELHQ
jgi:ribosome-interacting GTPase 1